VLVALATVGLASFAFATTASARTPTPKPTVVLVHGAFADSSSFDGVIDRLRRDGYHVRAAPVRGFLDSIKGPKILVGHSYGGAVITQAASGDPDVKALIYVAAFALDSNEVLSDLANRPVAHPIAPLPTVPFQSKQPDGTTRTDIYWIRCTSAPASPATCRDASPLTSPRRNRRPAPRPSQASSPFEPAWKTIPSWYLVAKQDNAIAPDL
jgi:pimeloyl-ACP methyl ester carboxylesterase